MAVDGGAGDSELCGDLLDGVLAFGVVAKLVGQVAGEGIWPSVRRPLMLRHIVRTSFESTLLEFVHLSSQLHLTRAELRFLPAGAATDPSGCQTVHGSLRHEGMLELGDGPQNLEKHSSNRSGGVDSLVESSTTRSTLRACNCFDSSMRCSRERPRRSSLVTTS